MKRKTWIAAVAAVVVLAAAGTTALLLSGGDDSDYKTLPTCDKLSAALPGKPALSVTQNVTGAEDYHGLHPGFTNIECSADPTRVHVELYQPSDMDLYLLRQYADHKLRDGAWRANDMFSRQTQGFDQLNPNVRYGSTSYTNSTCTVLALKRNATVALTVHNGARDAPAGTTEQWKAACRQIAEKQMPKVLDAALG